MLISFIVETYVYSDITKSSTKVKRGFDSQNIQIDSSFLDFIESSRLEKILKIIKSKCKPNTAKPVSLTPCLQIGF